MDFRPIILAGGSGTRFWPRSRKARAKQVLAVDGERSMICATADRLAPLVKPGDLWVITNHLLAPAISSQIGELSAAHLLCEPAPRNTAPAAGLAAMLVERTAPDAVLGIFPADQVIADEAEFRSVISQGVRLAASGENIVVLGIQPTHPETGYGYIEAGESIGSGAMRVRRFTEKPNRKRADEFLASGRYYWNSGIFLWSARTLAAAVREHLSETAPILEKIAAAYGTPEFESRFHELYPQCENISIDYGILEPRSAKGEHQSNLFCLPANFGWNDLGSWAALYEHKAARRRAVDGNVAEAEGSLAEDASGNYVYSPGKFAVLVGVHDLVVVETDDAILVTTRERSQDIGKVVKKIAAVRSDLV